MSPEPYNPNFGPPPDIVERTDFHSLVHEAVPLPDALPEGPVSAAHKDRLVQTDFSTLKTHFKGTAQPIPRRSITDYLIDGITPIMVFTMVYAVIYFLLDVRYVYTAVMDANLRWVAFCFIMGVVALNRLIAQENMYSGYIYFIGLAGAVGLYTLSTTGMYDMGSVSRNFMNSSPWLATGFNLVIVAFIWWLTNRLTYECCIDENHVAGEMGILTGTARKIQKALQRDEEAVARRAKRRTKDPFLMPYYELEPYDPLEGPKEHTHHLPARPKYPLSAADRLAKRHPGMSIFYFSIPVMFIFAVGLRIVQHGGQPMVLSGLFYMGIYTVSALTLLMLTSLAGLREYFRARGLAMPPGIGLFWVGLGFVMIAMVLVGAAQLPKPGLPPMAHVDEHVSDPWARGQRFELTAIPATATELMDQSQFMERLGNGVLICFGLFLAFAALKGIAIVAARFARNRDVLPKPVVRFFDGVEFVATRLTRLPELPKIKRRVRIQRDIATSARYGNSMADPVKAKRMAPTDHVQYAYEALCALAYDLGVPRKQDQTPYEFIDSFPEAMESLRDEAAELTRLYVVAAYSPETVGPRALDRLRRFWITYHRVRNRIVK